MISDEAGQVSALQYEPTGGLWHTVGAVQSPQEALRFEFDVTDDVTEMTIDGTALSLEHNQRGAAGLGVYDAHVIFELSP